MLKHVYKLVISLIIFVVAMVIFSRNIHEENNEHQEVVTTTMSEATFPIVNVVRDGYSVNTLHGYLTSLDAVAVRDGVVPVGADNNINFKVTLNQTKITKGTYDITDIRTGDTLESGNISSFEENDGVIDASFQLTQSYTDSVEYAMTITLVTQKGDKIKYYSRIIKTDTTHFKDIIDYAMEFHADVLDKDTASNVVNYIEPDSSMTNTDLAYVNIHSSLNLISYGSLGPKVITDVQPKIHSVTQDTAIIELEFYVQADTASGTETYKVDESFRIRWTATRMYLLAYDRTMESVFDINLISLSGNEFKLGITQDTDANCLTTSDESKVAFVRNGELWCYNTAVNDVISVFSFRQENTDYIRDVYDNHDIRILGMDNVGNIDFIVYGYMNSGEYEGRMGIILYKYHAVDRRIEERVYIPVNVPFNILEGYISDFAYVNKSNVFFFAFGGCIYSYDMITDEFKVLAEGVDDANIAMPENGGFMAWMSSDDTDAVIYKMDLEAEAYGTLKAKEGTCIRLLGALGSSIIYGYAGLDDISSMADGSRVIPISQVVIADINGKVEKEYIPQDCYVTTAQMQGNKVKLNQVKKDSDGYYVPSGEDYIFNSDAETANIKTTYRLTDTTMTEWYMSIPGNINISQKPTMTKAEITKIGEDSKNVIRIDMDSFDTNQYYVFSYHGLEQQYSSAGEAVAAADELMGLVYDNEGNLIWERGNTSEGASVDVDVVTDSDSVAACMRMLIESDHVSLDGDADLSIGDKTIIDRLSEYMNSSPANLTGASLDEIFYFIDRGRPVLAMISPSEAVLIVAYSSSKVRYVDTDGTMNVRQISDAAADFESVGNIFISYVN